MDKKSVVVAEGWDVMRDIIESALRDSETYEIVAMFPTAESIERYCDENPVDLLVVEGFVRKGVDGIEAAGRVKKKHPEIKILILVNCMSTRIEKRLREAGLDGFWEKRINENEFRGVLDVLSNGGKYFQWNAAFYQTPVYDISGK